MTTVLKSGLDYMEHLKRQWKEDHKGQPDENDCDDWILVAFADDIFICAPPGIAAKMYMRLNYLVQEELKMEFHHGKLKVIQATSDPKTRLRSRNAIRRAFQQGAQKQQDEADFVLLETQGEVIKGKAMVQKFYNVGDSVEREIDGSWFVGARR